MLMALIPFLLIAMLVQLFIVGVTYGDIGRFPRPIFNALYKWFWPFRSSADTGVMLYMAYQMKPEAFTLVNYPDGFKGNINGKSFIVDMRDFKPGRCHVKIDGVGPIPISAWGDNRLYMVWKDLVRVRKNKASSSRTKENQAIYFEGTKLAASLLEETVYDKRPDLLIERKRSLKEEATLLTAQRQGETFSKMLVDRTPGRW